MSPQLHDVLPTYRTAHSPRYGACRRTKLLDDGKGDALDQVLHASCELLPPFHASFCSTLQHSAQLRKPPRLPLLSARHRDVASSRRPANPTPPRGRGMMHREELVLRPVGGIFAEACRWWRGWRWRGAV
ncbi:hypothetical protein JB92DRAFT_3128962 [Gautieria morchelliformis]|nr:hypothetical protein JB92DRAFT_3128962 [Gautieria morchelliformis]